VGAGGITPGSDGWHGNRRSAAALLACLALVAQVFLAVLPVVVATTRDDPFAGAMAFCHSGPGPRDRLPAQSDPAPGHHAADCPLCFTLHQLWSYVPATEPALVPPSGSPASPVVAAAATVARPFPHGPQQPRAPPFPT
jgi:hypothetical protein